jgi:uncharacterized protein DUF29
MAVGGLEVRRFHAQARTIRPMPKATKTEKPSRLKTKRQSRGAPGAGAGTSAPVSFKAVRTAAPNRETDFYAWLLAQANELRVHQPDAVDWEGLAEELEEMAARTRDALTSNLEQLFIHLLKLQFEPSENERRLRARQWKLDAMEHRNRVNDLLNDSRTLRNTYDTFQSKAYPRACRHVAVLFGDRLTEPLPDNCPWTLAEIRNDDFFPDTRPNKAAH